MRLEILVETQIEILDGPSSGLFSNEPCEKRPVIIISTEFSTDYKEFSTDYKCAYVHTYINIHIYLYIYMYMYIHICSLKHCIRAVLTFETFETFY